MYIYILHNIALFVCSLACVDDIPLNAMRGFGRILAGSYRSHRYEYSYNDDDDDDNRDVIAPTIHNVYLSGTTRARATIRMHKVRLPERIYMYSNLWRSKQSAIVRKRKATTNCSRMYSHLCSQLFESSCIK